MGRWKKIGSIKKRNQIGLLMTSIRCFSFDVLIRVFNWNSMFHRKIDSLSQLNIFMLDIRSRIHGYNQLPYLNKDFISNRFLIIDFYDERQRSLKLAQILFISCGFQFIKNMISVYKLWFILFMVNNYKILSLF